MQSKKKKLREKKTYVTEDLRCKNQLFWLSFREGKYFRINIMDRTLGNMSSLWNSSPLDGRGQLLVSGYWPVPMKAWPMRGDCCRPVGWNLRKRLATVGSVCNVYSEGNIKYIRFPDKHIRCRTYSCLGEERKGPEAWELNNHTGKHHLEHRPDNYRINVHTAVNFFFNIACRPL